jgi:hypothetical protein
MDPVELDAPKTHPVAAPLHAALGAHLRHVGDPFPLDGEKD